MTHSYNRTMLARLGFDDPDKREPDHELACEYLSRNAMALAEYVMGDAPGRNKPYCWAEDYTVFAAKGSFCWDITKRSCRREEAITKGRGQYATTVGFMDLTLEFEVDLLLDGHRRSFRPEDCRNVFQYVNDHKPEDIWSSGSQEQYGKWRMLHDIPEVAVEVKAAPIPVSDIIRQINLYCQYTRRMRWVAATCFPVSKSDLTALHENRISHVFLGQRFQEWKKSRDSSRARMQEI